MKLNDKQLGLVLIIIGILIVIPGTVLKIYEGVQVQANFDNPLCTNDPNCKSSLSGLFPVAIFWFIGAIILSYGFLLRRSDELDEAIKSSDLKINEEFKKAKKKAREKDSFIKFQKGFTEDEIDIINIIHTKEGITEKQLEKRVSIPNNKFKSILNNLEKKGFIEKMVDNNTFKLYLKKLNK